MSFGLIADKGLFPTKPPNEPVKTATPSTTINGKSPEVIVFNPRTRITGVLLSTAEDWITSIPVPCPPNNWSKLVAGLFCNCLAETVETEPENSDFF